MNPASVHAGIDPANITGDLGAILLAHARHADGQLLYACAPLTDAQLDRPFEMGPGSLRATVTEIFAAMRIWGDVYAERPARPWMADEGPFSVAQFRDIARDQHEEWAAIVRRFPLGSTLTRERNGTVWSHSRAQILAHVFTHSVHHRAQAINMLRHLTGLPAAGWADRPALPSGSVITWARSLS
jgi:uncharacterized damage-inducible protein DinB